MSGLSRRLRSRALVPLVAAMLVALVASLPATPAAAQEEPAIDLVLQADPPAATIGALVTLRVIAEHDNDVIVTIRPPRASGVDLIDSRLPVTETLPNGRERTTYEFVVQPFALGTIPIEDIRVDWLREDSATGSQTLTGQSLQVTPTRAPGDTELRPLKAQLEVPGAPPAWVRPAVAAGVTIVIAGLVAAVAVALWRRRAAAPAPTLDMTAEERARAALDGLTGSRLASEADFQHFYGTISVTIRGYLQERFGFNATALTTSELEERMVSQGVDRWQARLVGGLLDRCDAAVYARHYPDPASADHDLTVAYEIVELSRPRIEEPEEEGVPA